MRRLHTCIAIIICLTLFGIASTVQASDRLRLDDYLVRATDNTTGQNFCTLSMRFSDGNTVTFSRGLNGHMTVALDYSHSILNTRFKAGIFTGDDFPAYGGQVVSDHMVVFRIPDGDAGLRNIANQSNIAMRIGGRKLNIPINDMTARQAFKDFNTCLAELAPVSAPAIMKEKMEAPKVAKSVDAPQPPQPSTDKIDLAEKKLAQNQLAKNNDVKINTNIIADHTINQLPVRPTEKPAQDIMLSAGKSSLSMADETASGSQTSSVRAAVMAGHIRPKPVAHHFHHPQSSNRVEKNTISSNDMNRSMATPASIEEDIIKANIIENEQSQRADRRIPDIKDTRWTRTENDTYRMDFVGSRFGDSNTLPQALRQILQPLNISYTPMTNQAWKFSNTQTDTPITGQYIEITADTGLLENGIALLDQQDQACSRPVQSAIGLPDTIAGITILPVEWQCGKTAGATIFAKDQGKSFRMDLSGSQMDVDLITYLRDRLRDQIIGINRI